MEVKKERIIAYGIGIILFVVGVVCYAAFPLKTPEQPIRVMLKANGGNVLFDHYRHSSEDGYSIECSDCHHDLEDGAESPSSCGECHKKESTEDNSVKISDAFHNVCVGCHKDNGSGPTKCSECHAF